MSVRLETASIVDVSDDGVLHSGEGYQLLHSSSTSLVKESLFFLSEHKTIDIVKVKSPLCLIYNLGTRR
jgi:hypothetical protein